MPSLSETRPTYPKNREVNLEEEIEFPILVSSDSFERPFIPVMDVPFCVSCEAHVVTSKKDIKRLEKSESCKEKGSILVSTTLNGVTCGEESEGISGDEFQEIRDDVGGEDKEIREDGVRIESDMQPSTQFDAIAASKKSQKLVSNDPFLI